MKNVIYFIVFSILSLLNFVHANKICGIINNETDIDLEVKLKVSAIQSFNNSDQDEFKEIILILPKQSQDLSDLNSLLPAKFNNENFYCHVSIKGLRINGTGSCQQNIEYTSKLKLEPNNDSFNIHINKQNKLIIVKPAPKKKTPGFFTIFKKIKL